jgi:hypothetical protein
MALARVSSFVPALPAGEFRNVDLIAASLTGTKPIAAIESIALTDLQENG